MAAPVRGRVRQAHHDHQYRTTAPNITQHAGPTIVGARPCGCPGAGWGTPSAPRSSTSHHHAEPGHRFARNTPSFQTQRPGIPSATTVIPSGARNLGMVREVWRLGALGVPHPAPGQPQGRAPTGALSFGDLCHSERSEESRHGARGLAVWCARRTRSSFRAQYPVIPNAAPRHSERDLCHSERSEESRRVARGLAVRCVWRTPPRTGAATRACPYGCVVVWRTVDSGLRWNDVG